MENFGQIGTQGVVVEESAEAEGTAGVEAAEAEATEEEDDRVTELFG